MAEKEPTAGQPYFAGDTTPWLEARERLADADTYWLATVRTDGLPHLVPLLGVWVGGALHFVASRTSRKARNLARDLVVEGEATKVSGEVRLHRVAEAYMSKYGWPVTVRECAFYADGAPTAGPPPYAVYEVIPQTAFGFPTEEGMFRPTRWRF